MAVRRYTSLSWNATGPSSFHHWTNRGCHDSRARCSRRSLASSTLFGIVASMSTAVMPGSSDSLAVVLRPRPRAEAPERAVGSDGVGTLEDPVLPRRQTAEDLRLHRLRPDEAVVGLHPGQGVGREAGAFLQRDT